MEGSGRKFIRVFLARLGEAPDKLLLATCPGNRVTEGRPHHSSMAAVCNHTAMNAVNMVPSMTRDNPTEFGGRDIKQQSYCGTLGFLTYPRGSLGICQEKFPQRQCGRTECDQETGELSSYFDS